MHIAPFSHESLAEAAWYLVMAAAGVWLAVATPYALRFIDKGFPNKQRDNPTAAAKQVKTFRFFGVFFALAGATLLVFNVFGIDK